MCISKFQSVRVFKTPKSSRISSTKSVLSQMLKKNTTCSALDLFVFSLWIISEKTSFYSFLLTKKLFLLQRKKGENSLPLLSNSRSVTGVHKTVENTCYINLFERNGNEPNMCTE